MSCQIKGTEKSINKCHDACWHEETLSSTIPAGGRPVTFEFCWEHNGCTKECIVRETGTVFCWRLAREERLCHPENCAACAYKQKWFARDYDLQAFLAENDRRAGKRSAQRVLAVDDEPNFLSIMSDSIRDRGYNCLGAVDGEEGLFFAQETIPDLIVTDIVMPKIDGFELCRILKADVRTKEIPVIMVTVRGAKKDVDEGIAIGADAYLVKPVSHAELLEKIRELMPEVVPQDRP
jgi:CheY-like chemotaxis protein